MQHVRAFGAQFCPETLDMRRVFRHHLDNVLNDGSKGCMGIAGTFKALSDSTRREILSLLSSGSMTAGEIGERFSMTGATISHHLSVLKQAGLVSDEKQGKYVLYELNMSMIDEIMRWAINLKGDANDEETK